MRVGLGYDCHRFGEGNFIMLGGEKIPHKFGIIAHSDGDVLLHALIDALFGAAALGDIGMHFPDTDPNYKGIASGDLLKQAFKKIQEKKFLVVNVDATIILEKPKLAPFISVMRQNISNVLQMPFDSVSVKAKTNEGMGFLGRQEGLAAQAVVLLACC